MIRRLLHIFARATCGICGKKSVLMVEHYRFIHPPNIVSDGAAWYSLDD